MGASVGDDSQDDFIFAGPSSSHAPLQASSSHSGHLTSPPPPPPPQQMRSTEEVPSTRGTPSTDYSAKEYLAANMLVDYRLVIFSRRYYSGEERREEVVQSKDLFVVITFLSLKFDEVIFC